VALAVSEVLWCIHHGSRCTIQSRTFWTSCGIEYLRHVPLRLSQWLL